MRALTTSQAAEICGVSADTVRRWMAAGVLRGCRLPSGARRFDPIDILNLKAKIEATAR